MMLRPTATSENSSRGNTAYGESGSYYDPNTESNGKYNLHGDVARICLYVYVRWGNTGRMWGASGVMESKEVLLKWMEEDPVDTWELGRNDAVQSITGTRNVFVDYPELAFDLFNAEIPNGYDTPSGGAPSYTITVTPNNAAYGSVSMTGKTITATPKTGYQVSGYKVTSGTATVTQSGNQFTVSASSDCAIQIIFTARTKTTVTFIDQGKTVSTLTPYAGDSFTLPYDPGIGPDGYVFMGWVDKQIEKTEAKPAIYAENSTQTATGDKTFYALYAVVEEGSTGEAAYRLVTDMSQLSQGASVVITSAASAVGMKQTGGSNNRYAGSITKNADNTITFDETLIDILTLGAGSAAGTYSFYSEANGQYLAAGTSTGSNILKMQSSVDAAASFTITVAADGTATITSQTSSDRKLLQYNSSANVFSCYASAQKAVSLYVSSGSGIAYYTTEPNPCEHENTRNVAAVPATCTESGYTAGVYCGDCDTYISGREVVAALGHSYGAWEITTAPTCTAAGVQTSTCSACGSEKTQSVAATGHSYQAVVTPPTAGEEGYTTYTCSACGDSYRGEFVYIVKFKVPAGVSSVENMECGASGIKLPTAGVPAGKQGYVFAGWTTERVEDTAEAPKILEAGKTYTATDNITLYALYTYVVGGTGSTEYTLKDLGDIEATDTVVVTMTAPDGTVYALPNNASSSPSAVTVTASNGKLTAAPADTLLWNISGAQNAYVFTPNGAAGTYLYCTSTNSGVKIGSSTANTFTLDSTGYLKHNGTGRFLGVYTGKPDWRCYTSPSINIDGQVLGFYVKGQAGTTYYTTVSPEDVAVETWNISLGDDIGVNFVIKGADTASFTVAGKAVAAVENGDVFSICLAAAQMSDEIVITVNGEILESTYSVRKYADAILSGSDESTKNLVKAMLCYGAAAQDYFDYNRENPADAGIALTMEAPTGDTGVQITDSLSGLNFYGASLLYENKTAVRFYFSGSIDGLTFSRGTALEKNGLYYVDVDDINPQQLGDDIQITVTDENGSKLTVVYSPLTYIVRMYEKQSSSEVTKALVQALYNYYLAAKAYTN